MRGNWLSAGVYILACLWAAGREKIRSKIIEMSASPFDGEVQHALDEALPFHKPTEY